MSVASTALLLEDPDARLQYWAMRGTLLGRARELRALDAALARAQGGGLESVLIEAAPGLGKTRLLREAMVHAAARGFTVLHAECDLEDRYVPFAATVKAFGAVPATSDAARRSLGQVLTGQAPATAADPRERYRAANAAVAFLEASLARGPVLLVFDDVQDADSGTLLMLRQAARTLADNRLALLLAARPDAERPLEAELRPMLHLHLPPFDAPSVAALAAELIGTRPGPELLQQLDPCGGNPLLVIQMVRHLEAGGGAGAADILLQRVRSAPDAVSSVLRLASVLGRTFSMGDLAALAGAGAGDLASPLARARTAGLLVDRPDGFAFSHALLWEVVHGALVR